MMSKMTGKLNKTEGWVMISSSCEKQLKTLSATDWNMSFGHPSGLSLLRNIRAKKEYPIPCKEKNSNYLKVGHQVTLSFYLHKTQSSFFIAFGTPH